MGMRTVVVALVALVVACAKTKSGGGDAGDDAAAVVVHAEDAGPGPTSVAHPPAGAAVWSRVARFADDPVLAKQLAVLLPHFGADGGAKGFDVQRIDLVGTRQATLVAEAGGANPMVLVTEGDALLWTKDRPVAGIVPPVEHVTISAHAALGVALFAWDPPTKIVIGRVWADDSNAFGDFEMLHVDACDDVVAGYVPDQGIYVVAATPGGPMLQVMNENNVLQRGRNGTILGAPFRAPAPLSLVVGEDGSMFLARWANASAKTSDLLEVTRYQKGKATWPAPVTLEVPRASAPVERIAMKRLGDGIRIELAHGAVASRAVAVSVDATAAVTRLEK